MKKFILYIIPLLLSHLVVAQHSSNAYRKLADSLVRTHNYATAVTYYEKAIKNAPVPGDVMLQIAKCNQKMNRINDADKWYHDAKSNHANFSSQDSYDFVYILIGLHKREEAESVLQDLIREKPGDLYAKRILNDLLTIEKYYKDSTAHTVAALSINTPASEFAPAYYKEGIVFSSAQPTSSTRKKSPWDNSDFLTLYHSVKTTDQQFQKPVVLEEKLDSRYHDGPAVFYNGYGKMVLNRNQAAHAEGKKNTWIWHLSLFDAHYSTESKSWQLVAFPFDQPPYSTAHPFMTEDGNTLYFVSDRPGGYGGSDIYRATKVNGIWSKPFNLGPVINSPGNEVFPFISDNTLYFASNGQGGLGGLDIFKSELRANGFAPPVNVGYPINSTADDFSFITKSNGENGYFASSRNGNDDLFSFHKKVEMIKMLAYIYDGKTKQPIANAQAKLMSLADEDRTLTSDKDGHFHFELSRETAYILIASHEEKSGMINGFALPEEDQQHLVHQIPLFGDSATIHCVGRIQTANGDTPEASSITIFDETTGKIIQEDKNKSIVDFRGEKGHTYRVEIKNKNGDVTTQQIVIATDETKPMTWSMVLKDEIIMIPMAAHIFYSENNQSLAGAKVKVSTFMEEDMDLVTNENGIVAFTLKQGTAYLLTASKDSLNGIYLGEAEPATSKAAITHQVPLYGKPVNPVSITALITDDQGLPINNVTVKAVNKITGQEIPVKVTNGIISFLGERGKDYDIQVSTEGFKPVATTLSIPPDAADKVDEISIVLTKDTPSIEVLSIAAHIFKKDDKLPLAGAAVTILSLEADKELKSDKDGSVSFSLPEGTAYILIANRDPYSGMYSGIVENGPVLQVPTTKLDDKQAIVAGKLRDSQGNLLDEVTVTVTDKTTGAKTTCQFKNGLLGFVGAKGRTYTISVEDKNHRTQSKDVTIPANGGDKQNIDLVFGDQQQAVVAAKVKDSQRFMLEEVTVAVTDKTTGQTTTSQFKNGLLGFAGVKGRTYTISAEDKNHHIQTKDITIPADGGAEQTIDIVFGDQQNTNKNSGEVVPITAHIFKEDDKLALTGAAVTILSLEPDKELTADNNGNVSFTLPEGTAYILVASRDHYSGMYSGIVEKGPTLQVATTRLNDQQTIVAAKVKNSEGFLLDEVTVAVTDKTTGQTTTSQFKNGLLGFVGVKGRTYTLSVEDNNHQLQSKDITIPADGSEQNVDLVFGDQQQTSMAGKLKDSQGNLLDEVIVTVTDKTTGQTTTSQFKNSLLEFVGVKGRSYTLSVEDKNHHLQTQDVTIPADGGVEQPIDIIFGDQQQTPVAKKLKDIQGNLLDEVIVTVTDKTTGQTTTSQFKNSLLEFVGIKGRTYTLTVENKNHQLQTQDIAIPADGSEQNVDIIFGDQQQTSMAGKLKDSQGNLLDEVTVTVTDKTTGQTTTSQFKNSLLEFVGVKGRTYTLTVEDKNHHLQTQDVTIPADGRVEQNIDIVLGGQQNVNKNSIAALSMSAHVYKKDDNLPLAGAAVTIITLDSDIALKADNDGNVAFTLSDGTAFVMIANRDNYSGMYAGDAEKGPVLQVATTRMNDKQTIVAGKITNSQGFMLEEVTVTVTDKTTGQKTTSQFKNSLLGFVGVKGRTYILSVEDKNHQIQSKDITIADNAGADQTIDLVFDNKADNITSSMIRLKNDGGGDKFYISSGNSNAEITERNGMLYLNDGTGEKALGDGTLGKLQNDPSYLKQLGLVFDEIIDIENIYFDYNKTTLDDTDRKELEKAKTVLQRYPHLQLTISAHADDRGTNKYNLNLSKRRAKAVASYLTKIGVNRDGVSIEAHGEATPAIPCPSGMCNEEQRQKNRRAEFSLRSTGQVVATRHAEKSKTKSVSHKKATMSNLDETLAKYGDKAAEGLSFKVSIGAYRFNHTLTFDELKDLGTVEKIHVDGITYYYLSSFTTMRSAETVKQEVIKRHVKDAFVSIFRDNERITFKEFLILIAEDKRIAGTTANNE